MISCTNCGSPYPLDGVPFLCLKCGGLFDFVQLPRLDSQPIARSKLGIWRYQHTFLFDQRDAIVSLGEGNTPLVPVTIFGREVYFKCEYQNPTGSFKDRGTTVLVSWLKSRGVREAVEDSSGNAGASIAAYATRAGIRMSIFIPITASGPKISQIRAYGTEPIAIAGSRAEVTTAAKSEVSKRKVYASHAYLPFNIPGYATAAYEIYEQLNNRMPGAVILPVGQGGLILGLVRGFDNLVATGANKNLPIFYGVQAKQCAPMWLATQSHKRNTSRRSRPTLAEGVSVSDPVRSKTVLNSVLRSGGGFFAVEENKILPATRTLSELGFYVEPTSAIVLPALKRMINLLPDPIVIILTGSGLKYSQEK